MFEKSGNSSSHGWFSMDTRKSLGPPVMVESRSSSQNQTAIFPLSQPCIVFISVSSAVQSHIIAPSEPALHLGCFGAAGSEVEEMGGFMFV